MNDILRKGFLLGLGAAVAGKEKLGKKLDDLVEQNELTTEQAKSVMNNFIEKGKDKTAEWSQEQHDQAQKLAEELGLATLEDIQRLQMKIADLEKRISE